MTLPPSDDLARHAQAIRAFSAALCRQDSDAGDVAQSVMVLALEERSVRRGALGGWLRGAARLVARERYRSDARRTRREAAAATGETLPSAAERAARLEIEEKLIGWVGALPAEQSETVYLRFWEGLAPREIAARLGVPVGTVKTRLKRGLRRLRDQLSAKTPGGEARWMGILGALPAGTASWGTTGGAASGWMGGLMMKKALAAVAAILVAWGGWSWFTKPFPTGPQMATPSMSPTDSAPAMTVVGEVLGDGKRVALGASASASPSSTKASAAHGGRVIVGQVLNAAGHSEEAQGTPAAGVTVRLNWGWSIGPDAATAITDSQGLFRIEVPEIRSTDLVVSVHLDENFQHASTRIEFPTDETGERTCVITRYPNGGLAGTVTDLDLRPIKGVLVTATASREDAMRPPMQTRTDADGEFRFPRYAADTKLEFEAKGWALLSHAHFRQISTGEWEDVNVILSRHGTLTVRIVDDSGNPIPDASVHVARSAAETFARKGASGRHRQTQPVISTTDANGKVTLEDVWANQKLEVSAYSGRQSWSWNRQGNECPSPGAPIVLEEGGAASLTYCIGSARRVSGRVVDAKNKPVAGAHVVLRSSTEHQTGHARLGLSVEADDHGLFTIEYMADPGLAAGNLLATDVEPYQLQQGIVKTPQTACREVNLQQGADGLVMELLPTYEIRGSVTDPDGQPVRAWIEVKGATPSPTTSRLGNGVGSRAIASKNGRFHIGGLAEGNYTLVFTHADSSALAVPDVAAGTTGLNVKLDGTPECLLHVEVVPPPGVELKKAYLQTAAVRGAAPESLSVLSLPSRATYNVPGGYADPSSGSNGYHGLDGPNGMVESITLPVEGIEATRGVRSGPGWVGVRGITTDGERLYPVGTGLVELTKGEHHLRFELSRTGSISGVANVQSDPTTPCFIALALPGGELLELMDKRAPYTTAELGARGDFRFDVVPTGNFELRIGTAVDLARGESDARFPIQIAPGANEPLILEMETAK